MPGKVVEAADAVRIFEAPLHPYTAGLLQSIPRVGQRRAPNERLQEIKGVVPIPSRLPPGCAFHPRCPRRRWRSAGARSPGSKLAADGHQVRCWLYV